jgi:hypothetical protein
MSALGHKRTSKQARSMSALPPEADIAERDDQSALWFAVRAIASLAGEDHFKARD